jgi:hypothetical protein
MTMEDGLAKNQVKSKPIFNENPHGFWQLEHSNLDGNRLAGSRGVVYIDANLFSEASSPHSQANA